MLEIYQYINQFYFLKRRLGTGSLNTLFIFYLFSLTY